MSTSSDLPEVSSNTSEIHIDGGVTTPYTRTEIEISDALDQLVYGSEPRFIDKFTNPEIGDMVVYKIPGNSSLSDPVKTLESKIFSEQSSYEEGFIEEHFSIYDANSTFLMLVDTQGISPRLVGGLRIIDCNEGPCETVSMFKEFYGEDTPLPVELARQETRERVWDILTVVIDPEYRDGISSAWLYHALYRMTGEEDVQYWIANITPKEMRNLREYIGVPFEEIPGVDEVVDISPIDGKESKYGFYSMEVPNIFPAIATRIGQLESPDVVDEGINAMFARIARLVLLGTSKTDVPNQ